MIRKYIPQITILLILFILGFGYGVWKWHYDHPVVNESIKVNNSQKLEHQASVLCHKVLFSHTMFDGAEDVDFGNTKVEYENDSWLVEIPFELYNGKDYVKKTASCKTYLKKGEMVTNINNLKIK